MTKKQVTPIENVKEGDILKVDGVKVRVEHVENDGDFVIVLGMVPCEPQIFTKQFLYSETVKVYK